MARFIDRRTSALMRGLNLRDDVLAGVGADGTVTVEGHYVGRLRGLRFDLAQGGSALEDKTLRAAAQRAVAPEVTRRLGALAADADEAFGLSPDGAISWNGEAAGRLSGGRPFAPKCRLYGEMGAEPARERARRRLEAFVAGESSRRLAPLKALEDAIAQGSLRGLARGVAYRMMEAGGVLARREVAAEIAALSQGERRALRSLGVRLGAFSLFLPDRPQRNRRRPCSRPLRRWRRRSGALRRTYRVSSPRPSPPPRCWAGGVWRRWASWLSLSPALEALSDLIRRAEREAGAVKLPPADIQAIGLEPASAARLLKALGYTRARQAKEGEPELWRHRTPRPALPPRSPSRPRRPSRRAPLRRAAAARSPPWPPCSLPRLTPSARRPRTRRAPATA